MSGAADGDRIADLFHRAIELPANEREAFVRREAADEPAVVVEALALLAADRERTQAELQSPFREPLPASTGAFGRYRVLAEIGEGGMGRVYRAEQREPVRRLVAIKLLKRLADSASGRARFRAEQQVLVRLQHRGIARVLDGGHTAEGRPFLVMELVDGEPLHRWAVRRRPDLDARLDLFDRICDAVAHAHRKGVIHRDLKPSNVLVVDGDDGPEPRVIDFGIARTVAVEGDSGEVGEPTMHTGEAVAMGTAGYMSPEQARDAAGADVRSDVYGLGAMLYELLTGELPRGRIAAGGSDAWRRDPVRPSRLRPGLPADLDWVVLRALELEPERRYATVGELQRDVQRVRRHEAVTARAPTAIYLGARFLRRHRFGVAIAALLLVFVAAAGAAMLRLWDEAERSWRDYRRLVDDKRLADLRAEARDALWPPWPSTVPAIDRWLERAAALLRRRDDIAARAAELEARRAGAEPAQHDEIDYQREVLQRLVRGLDALVATDPADDNLAGVTARRELAVRVGQRSLTAAADAWRAAIAAIADPAQCPAYGGLQLPGPQPGLVPIGRDARSGLWTFWHVESGAAPEVVRDDDGAVRTFPIGEETAMVFVLVPGGRFTMGALTVGDAHSGTAPIDPDAAPMERFVRDLTIEPMFVGMHEITQGQWLRLTGERPSMMTAQRKVRGHRPDLRWPVEQVSWHEADAALRRRGLLLPTEAQWEYFARAGTTSVFGGVGDGERLDRHANLADAASESFLRRPLEPGLDDGYAMTAPVGVFAPNPFGLFDCHGNVAEWCRDWLVPYARPAAPGDGLRQPEPEDAPTLRVTRGGDFAERPLLSRVASRNAQPPDEHTARTGVRAVRAIRVD